MGKDDAGKINLLNSMQISVLHYADTTQSHTCSPDGRHKPESTEQEIQHPRFLQETLH